MIVNVWVIAPKSTDNNDWVYVGAAIGAVLAVIGFLIYFLVQLIT